MIIIIIIIIIINLWVWYSHNILPMKLTNPNSNQRLTQITNLSVLISRYSLDSQHDGSDVGCFYIRCTNKDASKCTFERRQQKCNPLLF